MNYEDLKQRIIYKKLLTTLDVRKSVTSNIEKAEIPH